MDYIERAIAGKIISGFQQGIKGSDLFILLLPTAFAVKPPLPLQNIL
jgi:hypothetical protein